MPSLLLINSSADLNHSYTRALTTVFAETWRSLSKDHTLLSRDVHLSKPPYLDELQQHQPASVRESSLSAHIDQVQREALDELISSDVIVIGAPMYNFGIPSTLKSWIDLIFVPGETAPAELNTQPLKGRTAVFVTAQGTSTADVPSTFVTDGLNQVFGASMGMRTEAISVGSTLAQSSERAATEFSAAQRHCREAAKRLSAELAG